MTDYYKKYLKYKNKYLELKNISFDGGHEIFKKPLTQQEIKAANKKKEMKEVMDRQFRWAE